LLGPPVRRVHACVGEEREERVGLDREVFDKFAALVVRMSRLSEKLDPFR
jgi:hypothetical protein